jgi:hypothetical protein
VKERELNKEEGKKNIGENIKERYRAIWKRKGEKERERLSKNF